jgi:tRNA(Ile)-lysidine synthase
LGVPHEVLRWDGSGRGNLQERAREARRRLLGGWARQNSAAVVLLGHTADDQAETVLMRLARGSGVDGLSGMPAFFEAEGTRWSRPFLGLGREELRDWLRGRGVGWVDDPSNEDPRFDRVRARAMLDRLSELGLTRDRLVRTAGHMARARVSLEDAARGRAARIVQEDGADLLMPVSLLREFDQSDLAGRILAAALQWVGGSERRPRWESLRRLATVAAAGRGATLAGCLIRPEGDLVRIAPESGRAMVPMRDPGQSFAGAARFG